jgi:hypothetical protein
MHAEMDQAAVDVREAEFAFFYAIFMIAMLAQTRIEVSRGSWPALEARRRAPWFDLAMMVRMMMLSRGSRAR